MEGWTQVLSSGAGRPFSKQVGLQLGLGWGGRGRVSPAVGKTRSRGWQLWALLEKGQALGSGWHKAFTVLPGSEVRGLQVRPWEFLEYKLKGQCGAVLFNFGPPGDIWQGLETFLVVTMGERNRVIGIWWVEFREAAKCPVVHRTGPTTRNDVAPRVQG